MLYRAPSSWRRMWLQVSQYHWRTFTEQPDEVNWNLQGRIFFIFDYDIEEKDTVMLMSNLNGFAFRELIWTFSNDSRLIVRVGNPLPYGLIKYPVQ